MAVKKPSDDAKPNKPGFSVIRSLSDYAHKVGEIDFPSRWIPEGDYNGVVKELRDNMKDYKIQLAYIPSIDDDVLVYLPPISLPSGFEATPFPINVRRNRENGTNYYLNCGVEKTFKGRDHVYAFDGSGDYLGMWGSDEKERGHYLKELMKLFESGDKGPETISGVDAVHLRKKIKGLSRNQLEKSETLFRKYKIEGTFNTVSHYISGQSEFISRWDVTNASRKSYTESGDDGFSLAASYKYSDERFKGSPNIISILLYSGRNSMLNSGGLVVLEEFSQLF